MMTDDDVCPAASVRCPSVATDMNECQVDSECPISDSVCCTNGCVNKCIVPAGESAICSQVLFYCKQLLSASILCCHGVPS